jgi:hypothetical protein
MKTTEVANEAANQTNDQLLPQENIKGAGCAANACPFSNYYTLAFMIPFLSVTVYSLYQGASCSGQHACAVSAVAVGALAGLTSLGLVAGIKKFRKSTLKQA